MMECTLKPNKNKPSLLFFGNLVTEIRKEANTVSLCTHDLFTYKLVWEKCNWVVVNKPTVGEEIYSLPAGK